MQGGIKSHFSFGGFLSKSNGNLQGTLDKSYGTEKLLINMFIELIESIYTHFDDDDVDVNKYTLIVI